MTEKQKKQTKEAACKTAKGVYIAGMIGVSLFAVVVLSAFIFVGVRLGEWLAPYFANL